MAASGTTQKKAPRHPMIEPRKLPAGAATAVASALPPCTTAIARGTKASGAMRIITAVDIDQHPPIETPRSARPSIKTV
jgi:hypothetical protein